jgi:hypothetical protein
MRAVQPVAMQVMWWPQLRLWQIVHIAYLQRERTPGAHLGGRTALRDDAFRALFTCQLALNSTSIFAKASPTDLEPFNPCCADLLPETPQKTTKYYFTRRARHRRCTLASPSFSRACICSFKASGRRALQASSANPTPICQTTRRPTRLLTVGIVVCAHTARISDVIHVLDRTYYGRIIAILHAHV